MNAPASVQFHVQKPSMEQALRNALTNPKTCGIVRDRLEWDSSQVSKFLSGGMGVTIDKIDAAIEVLGMVVTTPAYMDFLAYGAKIGANCYCARAGAGDCSSR
ncbi:MULTISPECIES: hypothetical protein [Achromobacter]|uniref:hypothetical protein n=1 Tax=Achromobacter TaxID=222 RepID=UPI000750EEA2|nr:MULTISPECIES: hypothetical protein [Achromobacter]MDH1299700.1 DNA-binding protein [Achromobacter sp. GD03932]RSE90327.1 DNA-binding protein [Achromobacter aegrifaciens]